MSRPLHLTSPHMHGADVKVLQSLLRRHGYHVKADGDFGSLTAAACEHARRDLGFPSSLVLPASGPLLISFLNGTKKPGPGFRLRAKIRRKRAGTAQGRVEAILHLAFSQLGTVESPRGSNRVLYSRWYGVTGAWCAMFVSWCCFHVKHRAKFRYSFVPNVVFDGHRRRNGLSLAGHPASDTKTLVVACFDWPFESRGEADHIGFTIPNIYLWHTFPHLYAQALREFGHLGSGDFWTVEGNTSLGNQSNGGEVMLRKRNRRDVQAFVRIHV